MKAIYKYLGPAGIEFDTMGAAVVDSILLSSRPEDEGSKADDIAVRGTLYILSMWPRIPMQHLTSLPPIVWWAPRAT